MNLWILNLLVVALLQKLYPQAQVMFGTEGSAMYLLLVIASLLI